MAHAVRHLLWYASRSRPKPDTPDACGTALSWLQWHGEVQEHAADKLAPQALPPRAGHRLGHHPRTLCLAYPLILVPPPIEAYDVPPQNVLAAEAHLIIATDLHGKVSYLNGAALRAL